MAAPQPTGFGSEVLQPFNIPTTVGGAPPIQAPPRMNLQFPTFTPPAASSYGTTTPVTVPWSPPDLAGAIDKGIETGAHLATDAFTNRKTLNEIQAQEAVSKHAIAAMSDPNLQQNIGYEMGPTGFSAKIVSPAEVLMMRQQLAAEQAKVAASQAETAARYGETGPAKAAQAKTEAETEQEKIKTKLMGTNMFERLTGSDAGASSDGGKTSSDSTDLDF